MSDQAIPYDLPMDRANTVRSSRAYDPSKFIPKEEPEDVCIDESRWTAMLGLFGLSLIGPAMVLSILASGVLAAGMALALMFSGWALFGMANYLSYRHGERAWMEPDNALRLVVTCLALALTSAVAGLTA
jgi:hypothetical protein